MYETISPAPLPRWLAWIGNGTLALALIMGHASLGQFLGEPAGLGLLLGVLVAGVAGMSAHIDKVKGRVPPAPQALAWICGFAVLAGAWTTWAVAQDSPCAMSGTAWIMLIVLVVIASGLGPSCMEGSAPGELLGVAADTGSRAVVVGDRRVIQWQQNLLPRICGIGRKVECKNPDGTRQVAADGSQLYRWSQLADISDVKDWPIPDGLGLTEPPGYTVYGQMPFGAGTYETINSNQGMLSAALQLPEGCNVLAEQWKNRAGFAIKVETVNLRALRHSKPVPHPDLLLPAGSEPAMETILNPIDLGVKPTGGVKDMDMSRTSTVVVAVKDVGKTNGAQVINYSTLKCVDTVLFNLDNSGGLMGPWMDPAAEGQAQHPCVDWPASTNREMEILLLSTKNAAEQRKRIYRPIMKNQMIPVAPELSAGGVPQIVIAGDESKGMSLVVKQLLEDVNDISRGARISIVLSCLEASSPSLTAGFKDQCKNKIMMQTLNPSYEPTWYYGADIARGADWSQPMPPGSARISENAGPLEDFTWYFMLDEEDIRRMAVHVAKRRPALDPGTIEAMDRTVQLSDGSIVERPYSTRWERCFPELFPGKPFPAWIPQMVSAGSAGSADPAPAAIGRPGGSPVSSENIGDAFEQSQNTQRAFDAQMEKIKALADAAERQQAEEEAASLPYELSTATLPAGFVADSFRNVAPPPPGAVAPVTLDRPLTGPAQRLAAYAAVALAGEDGLKAGEVVDALSRLKHPIVVHRGTVLAWFKADAGQEWLHQPYGSGAGSVNSRVGAYVITDKGRQMLLDKGHLRAGGTA